MRSVGARKSMRNRDGEPPANGTSFTPTHNIEDGSDNEEEDGGDVKKVETNFKETKEIIKLVGEFETAYGESKQQVNAYDKLGLKAITSIRVNRHCYTIIKDNIYQIDPNFDHDKIGDSIHNLKKSIQGSLSQLATLKGEYFAVSESIVNKDTNTFKLDQVKRARAKQIQTLEKFGAVETSVRASHAQIKDFSQTYHDWEGNLFQTLITDTEIIVEDTNTFMEEIDNKMDKTTQDILKIKQDLQQVSPQTKEHIAKLNSINAQVRHVEKILEYADEAMERNDQTKEKLTVTHEQSRLIASSLKKLKLVEQVEQTKNIEILVKNLQDWQDLYDSLKNLKENQIDPADFDAQKAQQEVQKYIDSISAGRKEEFDDLIKKIQKAAKHIRDGGEEQKTRLDTFSKKYLDGDMAKLISDGDLLFLSKEVTRYDSSILSMQGQKDATLEESTKIDVSLKSKEKKHVITNDDIHVLRVNLKTLEKQMNVDLPRIKQNIDMLEAFAIKALKNRLNEDNRKSQNQISQMKKNYEDLQKEIDSLNTKHAKVKEEFKALQIKLDTEDKEKDNDFAFKIADKLVDCDKDINGHKGVDNSIPGAPASLTARKKEIIASINKMVNQFNENNKLIKENNKVQKSEKEINDLIKKNKQIQDECSDIDEKVGLGKIFSQQIDERLNLILEPTIPELEEKYDEKNKLIDQCDDLFDSLEEKLKVTDANTLEQLADVNAALKKLQDQGPINNPTSGNKNN